MVRSGPYKSAPVLYSAVSGCVKVQETWDDHFDVYRLRSPNVTECRSTGVDAIVGAVGAAPLHDGGFDGGRIPSTMPQQLGTHCSLPCHRRRRSMLTLDIRPPLPRTLRGLVVESQSSTVTMYVAQSPCGHP